jgi:hypothetical protein
MKNHAWWKIFSLTLVFGILFAGCPNGGEGENSEIATLSGVTFQKDDARADFTDLGAPGKTWDDAAIVEGNIGLPDGLKDGAITVTQDDSGASVRFAQAANGSAEPVFGTENAFSFASNNYLWIEVTAPAGNQLFYKIKVVLQSENANLTSVTIAGVTATLGTPGANETDTALAAGAAAIPSSKQAALSITVVKGNTGAEVTYATGATPGTYSATAPAAVTGSSETLWIKVVSQAGTVQQVYKIAITVKNDSTVITNASFKGTTLTVGTSGTQFLDTMDMTTFLTTPGAPSTDVTLSAAANLQGATLTATAPAGGTAKAVYSADGLTVTEFGSAPRDITSATYIGFEVTSEFGVTVYYRWRVLFGSGEAKLSSVTINSAATVNHLADAAWQTLLAEYNGAANANNDAPGAAAVEGTALIGWPAFGYGFNLETFTAVPRAPLSYTYNAASLATVNVAATPANNGTVLYALSANADGFEVVQGALPTSILQPEGGQASGSFTDVSSGTYIWIQVTSENKANVMYYRLRVASGAANANFTSMSVAGRTVDVSSAKATEAEALAAPVTLYFDPAVPGDAALIAGAEADSATKPAAPAAVAQDSNATVSYGSYVNWGFGGSTTWQEPAYDWFAYSEQDFGGFLWVVYQGLTDNTTILARIVAENGVDAKYIAVLIRTTAVPTPPEPESVEKIVAASSSLPVYQFTPPDGTTWSDYKTITYTVMVTDQAVYDGTGARAFIGGSYTATALGATGAFEKFQNWDDSRLVNITDNSTVSDLLESPGLNTWKTLSYPVVIADIPNGQQSSGYLPGTYYPADTAAGPFYFALGLTTNPNQTPNPTSLTYYIKDVALVKADGTTKLPADDLGGTTSAGASVGSLKVIFNNNTGAVTRTLESPPAAP